MDDMQASRDREANAALMSMMVSTMAVSAQSAAVANHTYTPQMGTNTMMVTNMATMNIVQASNRETAVRDSLGVALAMYFQRVQTAQAEYVIKTSHGMRRIRATSLAGMRDEFRKLVNELATS